MTGTGNERGSNAVLLVRAVAMLLGGCGVLENATPGCSGGWLRFPELPFPPEEEGACDDG